MTARRQVAAPLGVIVVSASMRAEGRQGGPRRSRGRPREWDQDRVWDLYSLALSRAREAAQGGPVKEEDIAKRMFTSPRTLRRLIQVFGRPPEDWSPG